MAEQYFTLNPTTMHHERMIDYQSDLFELKLKTDNGVFSKLRVDYGSRVLIKQMLLQKPVSGNILDVGCGYGPIGLAAATKWPGRLVEMIDVNERALDLARFNAQCNHLQNTKIYRSNSYAEVKNKFALIVTNPPIRAGKKVVDEILQAKEHLLQDGIILAVIQKKQGEPSARKFLLAEFGNCEVLKRDKGYYVLKSVNY